jgi:Family of unknown function (DUF6152)
MKTMQITALALVAGLLTVCAPVFAHHGSAEYNMTQEVELKNAKVTNVIWGNPHVLFFFDVTSKDGKVAHWVGETSSPSALAPEGWTSGTVRSGDVISTVYIFQAKDGRTIGRLERFVLASGKVLADPGGGVQYARVHHSQPNLRPNCDQKFVPGFVQSTACVGKAKTDDSKKAKANDGK